MSEDYRYPEEQYVLLGKIVKAHGLHGEVKIFSFSGSPENFTGYGEVHLVDNAGKVSEPFKIVQCRSHSKLAIVQLDTINGRNSAEKLEGLGVLLAKDQLPEVREDEYYWHQYEGKIVVDRQGTTIGRVENIFATKAQDILVVMSGGTEILIPVTKEIIVGEEAGQLVIDPPPGLLEINSGSE